LCDILSSIVTPPSGLSGCERRFALRPAPLSCNWFDGAGGEVLPGFPVADGSAAVRLAGQIFDTLGDKTVLLMGAGQMAELTARQLHARGVENLIVTSRTFDHAVALDRTLGGTAPLADFHGYLCEFPMANGSLILTRQFSTFLGLGAS
jgi:shikimate/quinate 5-dehydrogenase